MKIDEVIAAVLLVGVGLLCYAAGWGICNLILSRL